MTLRHLVWFPDLWARTRQVFLRCPGCVQKHNHQADKRIAGCYYPREKGNVAEFVHLDLAGPLPESTDGGRYILGIQCNFSGYCVTVPIKNKEHEDGGKGVLGPLGLQVWTSLGDDLGQRMDEPSVQGVVSIIPGGSPADSVLQPPEQCAN